MNRRLALTMRRKVKAMRRFRVEDLGEGQVRLTCTTCGHAAVQVAGAQAGRPGKPPELGSAVAKFMARYWSGSGQISGECAACTRHERDAKFPLPP